jgi:hypothetical protein
MRIPITNRAIFFATDAKELEGDIKWILKYTHWTPKKIGLSLNGIFVGFVISRK